MTRPYSVSAATALPDVTPKGVAPGHNTATAVARPRGGLQVDGGDVLAKVTAEDVPAAQGAVLHDPAAEGHRARRSRVCLRVQVVLAEVLHNATG